MMLLYNDTFSLLLSIFINLCTSCCCYRDVTVQNYVSVQLLFLYSLLFLTQKISKSQTGYQVNHTHCMAKQNNIVNQELVVFIETTQILCCFNTTYDCHMCIPVFLEKISGRKRDLSGRQNQCKAKFGQNSTLFLVCTCWKEEFHVWKINQ